MKNTDLLAHAFGDSLVRIIPSESGDLRFVAKDVCAVLSLTNITEAMRSLDEDERGSVILNTFGGNQEFATVTESGLYALIFKSRKKEARAFRKWVTAEILPAIRRTGRYEAPVAVPALPVDTDAVADAVLKRIEGTFAVYRLETAFQDERGWARLLRNHVQIRPNSRHEGSRALSDRIRDAGFRWDHEMTVWISPRTAYSENFIRSLFANPV